MSKQPRPQPKPEPRTKPIDPRRPIYPVPTPSKNGL